MSLNYPGGWYNERNNGFPGPPKWALMGETRGGDRGSATEERGVEGRMERGVEGRMERGVEDGERSRGEDGERDGGLSSDEQMKVTRDLFCNICRLFV